MAKDEEETIDNYNNLWKKLRGECEEVEVKERMRERGWKREGRNTRNRESRNGR